MHSHHDKNTFKCHIANDPTPKLLDSSVEPVLHHRIGNGRNTSSHRDGPRGIVTSG
jgi:hypothetical protein